MKCCHLSCSPCPCKQHPPHSSSLLTQICRLHLAAHTPICRLHLAPHSDMLSSLSSSQAFNCLHYAAHRPQYCFHLAAIFFTQLLTDLAVCFTQLLTNLAVVLTKLLIFFCVFTQLLPAPLLPTQLLPDLNCCQLQLCPCWPQQHDWSYSPVTPGGLHLELVPGPQNKKYTHKKLFFWIQDKNNQLKEFELSVKSLNSKVNQAVLYSLYSVHRSVGCTQ